MMIQAVLRLLVMLAAGIIGFATPGRCASSETPSPEKNRTEKPAPWNLPPPRDELLNDVTPNPVMVLYHTYNGHRTEVLDFSGHGSIGEFLSADRFKTGPDNLGLRFHGEWRSGQSQGYRIMESDALALKEGTISVWVWADPEYRKNGVLMACRSDKRKSIEIKIRRGGVNIKSTITGVIVKGACAPEGWFHLAVTFSEKKTALFINGKKVDEAGGSSLDGGSGFYIGYQTPGRKGFAGSMDDLKIYSVALDKIDDAASPPEPGYLPSGVVLRYNFQQTGDGISKAVDVSGNGLDADAVLIRKTGVPVDDKNAPAGDLAWELRWDDSNNYSYIRLPLTDRLRLDEGTIYMVFAVVTLETASDPRYTILGINRPRFKKNFVDIDLYCFHPNNHADLDPEKMTPFCLVGPGNRGLNKPRIPKMIHNMEWIKLVVAFDRHHVTVWLNDMKYDELPATNQMALFGDVGNIVIGASGTPERTNLHGSHILISDFKILNYKLTTYCKDTAGGDEKRWKPETIPTFKLESRVENRYTGNENIW